MMMMKRRGNIYSADAESTGGEKERERPPADLRNGSTDGCRVGVEEEEKERKMMMMKRSPRGKHLFGGCRIHGGIFTSATAEMVGGTNSTNSESRGGNEQLEERPRESINGDNANAANTTRPRVLRNCIFAKSWQTVMDF